ncbi:MAG: hypothetical protein FJY88_14205, partial [Candidatus Eisenbacteria bacterium]|nr:hypothetical protein [Candidatus Eisenbacteria bacterium]
LAGDDHYPDALISRLSTQSATQLQTQIARTIRYERDPDLGAAAAWYSKACGIASNATGGTGYYDWQRCNWLRDSLLAYTYVHVDQIYDPGATRLHVAAAINEGRGFVNYIGHGGTNYWTTTLFNVQDVYALTNGFMNPYICSVACLNGNFPANECFAEAWLRAGTGVEPKGGIGIYAASTNTAWVPPCDMQTEVVRLLTNEIRNSLGGLSFNGVSKAMDRWPGNEAVRLMEQYNLFGDCTVMMRTTEPAALTVAHAETLYFAQSSFDVATPGVAGARAALYAGGTLYGTAYTDGAGEATINLSPLPPLGSQLLLTVMAYNRQTIIDTVEVALEYLADVRVADYRTGALGPVAGVPTPIEILLANAGPDTAHDVTAFLRGLGGSAIADSVATYGHVAANTSHWGQDDYTFTPDPNLADSAFVSFALEIRSSDYQTWRDTLQVQVFAPFFTCKDAVVRDDLGDRDGRMDHGEICDVVIGLCNVGSADAAQIAGTLTCADPRVEIVQPIAQLTSLRSGENGYMEGTFSLRILPSIFEADIPFDLELETSLGRQQTVELVLPVGGYLETAEYGGIWCVHEAADSVHVDQWHV